MNNMPFRIYIRGFQFIAAVALCGVLSGFAVLVFSHGNETVTAWAAGMLVFGFLFLFLSAPFLAGAKCPACGLQFCGPQDENVDQPGTNVFTSECKYCGFSIRQTR